MRSYEALIAYHPEIGEAAIKDQIERVKQIIEGHGGEVTQVVEWGMRDLSYRIKKQRRAFYTVLVFKGDGATVAELERNLRIFEQVLRYMTTQIDPDRPPIELNRPRREAEDGDVGDGDYERREPRRRHDDLGLDDAGDVEVPDLS
ncbi:MAG: 30S ribosomal protein S6 [Deltaproteobacteria bacterium]|nr:30S ribosomal protein S6 [Deltaproteobacteria bacterium]